MSNFVRLAFRRVADIGPFDPEGLVVGGEEKRLHLRHVLLPVETSDSRGLIALLDKLPTSGELGLAEVATLDGRGLVGAQMASRHWLPPWAGGGQGWACRRSDERCLWVAAASCSGWLCCLDVRGCQSGVAALLAGGRVLLRSWLPLVS